MSGLDIAREGLRRALLAISPDDETSSVIHASEAVFWATALNEQHDPSRRHPHAPAVKLARNAVAHGAAICALRVAGVVSPVRSPMRDLEIVWSPVGELLAALNRPPRIADVDNYRAHLEGQPVDVTLGAIVGWYAPA